MISFCPDANNYEYHGIYGKVKLIIGSVYCKCPDFLTLNQTKLWIQKLICHIHRACQKYTILHCLCDVLRLNTIIVNITISNCLHSIKIANFSVHFIKQSLSYIVNYDWLSNFIIHARCMQYLCESRKFRQWWVFPINLFTKKPLPSTQSVPLLARQGTKRATIGPPATLI